jgi:hypothetical protein
MGEDIDGEAPFDQAGMRDAVDMSDDGLVVATGAYENDAAGLNAGHVRVFAWDPSTGGWDQRGSDVEGEAAFEFSGAAVELDADGDTLAVGAHGRGTNSGHVRVYNWDGSKWVQKGKDIIDDEEYDYSGAAIDLSADGDTVAVGAYKSDNAGDNAGRVSIYEWNGSAWIQKGGDLDGEEAYSGAGISVDMSADGNIVAVGAHENSEAGYHAGHTRVFQWNSATSAWSQMGSDINGESESDYSGSAIDLSSNGLTLAVGAYLNDGEDSNDIGHVRVYRWNMATANWDQMGTDIDGEAAYDNSGVSVDLNADGTILAVGAWGNDDAGINAGHARIYKWETDHWTQLGDDINGEAAWDHSGSSVDLNADGNVIAIGARTNDGGGINSGHVRVWSTCGHLAPTNYPTPQPTAFPTKYPTETPTALPTKSPTAHPTAFPTRNPTKAPTTKSPTLAPTRFPTESPTKMPTIGDLHPANLAVGLEADGSRGLSTSTWNKGWVKYDGSYFPGATVYDGVATFEPSFDAPTPVSGRTGSECWLGVAYKDILRGTDELTIGAQYTWTAKVNNVGSATCTFDGVDMAPGNPRYRSSTVVKAGVSQTVTYTFKGRKPKENRWIGGTHGWIALGVKNSPGCKLEMTSFTLEQQ